jgi:hypothetical protein
VCSTSSIAVRGHAATLHAVPAVVAGCGLQDRGILVYFSAGATDFLYSSPLSLTSALDGVGGQRHASAALPPGKIRYLLYRRLGGS